MSEIISECNREWDNPPTPPQSDLEAAVESLEWWIADTFDFISAPAKDYRTIKSYLTILEKERDEARAIFPEICTAIGNGAACSQDSSLEFLKLIPGEISHHISALKSQLESQTLYIDGIARNKARELCGEVMRHKTTNEEYPEIGAVECNKAFAAIETLISVNELTKSQLEKAEDELAMLEEKFCKCGPDTKSQDCPFHSLTPARP